MNALLVAEHDNRTLNAATLSAATAAREYLDKSGGGEVHILVAGCDARPVAEAAAALAGVSRIFWSDDAAYAHFLAEPLALLVARLGPDYGAVFAPATTTGKDLLPRVAALLDVQPISDILAIVSTDTFVRPTYAGNAIATVRSTDRIKAITVRTTAFPPTATGATPVPIEAVPAAGDPGLSSFVSQQVSKSERPELATARIVVSGGRGLGSAENFKLVEQLAAKLNAAVGASRAAVDAGFAPNDWQVGQTGKVVAPRLYVAIAISGAIQHLAGMRDSKVIVAINKDPEAPIFQVADYGLVGNALELVPQLCAALG